MRGALGCLQRRAGKQEVAGACARASGTRPPAYWQEVEDGGDPGWAGPHSAGPAQELGRLWWAAQVSFALFIIYCFLFSVVCFDLV